MSFVIFCGILAFFLQSMALHGLSERWRKLRPLVSAALVLPPLIGAAYYGLARPRVEVLGWEFGVAFCLWIGAAVLAGCLLAWGLFLRKRR